MKNYTDETISTCINNLLARLDEAYGVGMHWRGQTPDWYVCAAMVACDIEDSKGEASNFIMQEAKEYETLHRSS